MKKNRKEILDYINALRGYQGYVQFSDRRIEDVFLGFSDITVDPQEGFVYEAHFFNGTDTITIRQINEWWYVDEIRNVPLTDTQTYLGVTTPKIRMAQIWEKVPDELCEGLYVDKLSKVVFAGFVQGDEQ